MAEEIFCFTSVMLPTEWDDTMEGTMAIVMALVMYFVMIRPQRKKDKAVKDMLAALKPGDRICTIGGIYGTIASIKDETITLYVGAQKTQIVVARWAIRSVEEAPLVENESEALV